MPIRINLLAEALAEEDLRRRDPVKRAIYAGAFLVVLSFVWFSSTWLAYELDVTKLSQVQADITTRTNDYSRVTGDLNKISAAQKHLEALQKLSNARLLQGNLLNALQQLYVPKVQLTRLHVDQTYAFNSPAPADNASTATGHRSATEKIGFSIDAKDFSTNPGDQVNRYKDALANQDYFKSSLDPTNGVRLSNLSPPQTSFDARQFVQFTLECRFPDITR
jgi:hypothetical protein